MISKFQSSADTAAPDMTEFEGAITSSSNIRPDEVILRNFGSKTSINITLINGKNIDLPLHMNPKEKNVGTLIIPEKFYKEAETDVELKELLSGLFDNRRSLDVKVEKQENRIIVQPLGSKKSNFTISFAR